jgi:hypothetical protein
LDADARRATKRLSRCLFAREFSALSDHLPSDDKILSWH